MKRLLLSLLLAWVALAPAFAGSCAADCENHAASLAAPGEQGAQPADGPDCHGANGTPSDSSDEQTRGAGMIAACAYAAAASMCSPMFAAPTIDLDASYAVAPQLSPASALLPPPDKPPQR